MNCHYCGYSKAIPRHCQVLSPSIQLLQVRNIKPMMNYKGSFLRLRICAWMWIPKKGSHAALIDAFGNGEADILLGTQMIAKGLDFPNVTLVGVLNSGCFFF